jgi:hypothetical protein
MLAWTAVGTIASVAGFFVGLWVLMVARGAKRAADETKNLAQTKNLVEELEHACEKIQQIGIFARSQ